MDSDCKCFLHIATSLLLQLYYLFKVEFSDVSDIPNLDCISTFGKYGSGNPNLGSGQPNPPIKAFLTTSWEIWTVELSDFVASPPAGLQANV